MGRLRPLAACVVAVLLVLANANDAPDLGGQPTDDVAELRPDDGTWLTDADGRRYFLDRIPKSEARRLEDGSVISRFGVPLEVVSEDDRFYTYKVFQVAADVAAAPDAPDPADVAATYEVDTPTRRMYAFERTGAGLPRSGQWRRAFDVADVDGDRRLDVVTTSPRKRPGPPRVWRGNGGGRFEPWRITTPDGPYDYGSIVAGDLDADGNTDLVVGMHHLGVVALRGNGDGAFRAANEGLDAPRAGEPAPFSSQAVAATDLDGDEDLDIVALSEGPRLATEGPTSGARGLMLYRNSGDATWEGTRVSSDVFGPDLAAAALGPDDVIDVVTASSVFGHRELLFRGGSGQLRPAALPGLRPDAYVSSVAVGDLDDDGRTDIVVGYQSFEARTWRSGIDAFMARGRSFTREALHVRDGRTGVTALATGDVDDDGRTDVVGSTEAGQLLVFSGTRDGFVREREAPSISGCSGSHIELADIDRDGADEIIASFADEPERGDCETGGAIGAWSVLRR